MQTLIFILIFFFGSIIGSFLNVVILRLPRGKSLLGRSYCASCGRTLSSFELFPLFSFIALRGRCRKCGEKISWRYFIIEAIAGFLFAAAWLALKPGTALEFLLLARDWLVISVFLVIFTIDLEHYLILDSIVFPALAAVGAFNIAWDLLERQKPAVFYGHFAGGLIGAATAALPFFLIWLFSRGRWMGFGDVKFALLLGAVFGWPLWAASVFAAILLGGLASAVLLGSGRKGLKSQVPFGTFLALGGVIALFWGQRLLLWYLSLLGF